MGDRLADDSESASRQTGARHRTHSKTLKQRVRDIKRLLKRENVPATVRQTQERMLSLLETEVKDSQDVRRAKRLTKKYKMVRFFDRRKLTRKMKACNRQMTVCEDESERTMLSDQLTVLRKEYNYVVHSPVDEKYTSLHPSSGSLNDVSKRRVEEIQSSINSLVDSGSLPDASLNVITVEGKTMDDGHKMARQKQLKKSSQKVKRKKDTDQAGSQAQEDIYFIDKSRDDFFL